jgi:hypothetical protein
LETWVTETILVRRVSSLRYSSSSTWPLSSTGITRMRALGGRQLLPGHDVGVVLQVRDDDLVALAHVLPPQVLATRLMASVVPRTKMTSSTGRADEARTFSAPPS